MKVFKKIIWDDSFLDFSVLYVVAYDFFLSETLKKWSNSGPKLARFQFFRKSIKTLGQIRL